MFLFLFLSPFPVDLSSSKGRLYLLRFLTSMYRVFLPRFRNNTFPRKGTVFLPLLLLLCYGLASPGMRSFWSALLSLRKATLPDTPVPDAFLICVSLEKLENCLFEDKKNPNSRTKLNPISQFGKPVQIRYFKRKMVLPYNFIRKLLTCKVPYIKR